MSQEVYIAGVGAISAIGNNVANAFHRLRRNWMGLVILLTWIHSSI